MMPKIRQDQGKDMEQGDQDIEQDNVRGSVRRPSLNSRNLRRLLSGYALPAILVILVLIFSLIRPEIFFTVANLRTMLSTKAVLGILAIATMIPLVVNEFDLSVGSNLGLGAILVTGLSSKLGAPIWVSIIVALVACSLVGLINSLLIIRVEINSLIATLATASVVTGLVLWYTGGAVIFSGIPKFLTSLGGGTIIPGPLIALAVIAAIAWYVLDYTPLGRLMYATGGSKQAARLSGVPVKRLTVGAFVAAGFLAGSAGIMEAAILGTGDPTVGPSFLLPAFAAAFLGATAIHPGSFNVLGTIIAVYTIEVGVTGLTQLGVPFFIEPIFVGVALVIAVGLNSLLSRRNA